MALCLKKTGLTRIGSACELQKLEHFSEQGSGRMTTMAHKRAIFMLVAAIGQSGKEMIIVSLKSYVSSIFWCIVNSTAGVLKILPIDMGEVQRNPRPPPKLAETPQLNRDCGELMELSHRSGLCESQLGSEKAGNLLGPFLSAR
jgi:hypothetical protein